MYDVIKQDTKFKVVRGGSFREDACVCIFRGYASHKEKWYFSGLRVLFIPVVQKSFGILLKTCDIEV
jgi:hypothetical protein